jgi:signal transduction histidine kinase
LRRSIRIRVLVSILAVVVPLLAGSAWVLARTFAGRLERDVDVALEEEAETVAGLVDSGIPDESLRHLVVAVAAETDLGARKHVAVTRDGRPIAEAPTGSSEILATAAPGRFRIARYHSGNSQGVEVAIAVARSTSLLAHRRLTWLLWIGTPLVSALLGGAIWAILGRALRPLERVSEELGEIGARTLASRLTDESTPDEVGRIVRAANDMLARLERAVVRLQRFTAEAAHELRTPLTVLRTGLDVALSKDRPVDETRDALREASRQTERLCRLSEDLLTLARLDADAGQHGRSVIDLAELVRELAEAWADDVDSGQMRLSIEIEPRLLVDGVAGELYRMLANLIENAIRYGETGGEIRVRARKTDERVELEVIDDGPGIRTEDFERVFEPFYRGQSAASRAIGSGLGLAIAREIVRSHGGRLVVRNRDDGRRGTIFTASLPVAKDVAEFADSPPLSSRL